MKKFVFTFVFLLFMCIPSNDAQARLMPKVSQESLYNMQTAYINTGDVKSVMQAVIATLYDSDYNIEDINEELGLIRAQKTLKAAYSNKKRIAGWSVVLAAATAYTVFSYGATAASMYSPSRRIATELKDKTVIIDVNILIEQVNENEVKVKFIPIEKVLQNADGFAFNQMAPIKIIRIYKPQVYKEFFSQIKYNIDRMNTI